MLTACARGVLVSSWHRGDSLLPRNRRSSGQKVSFFAAAAQEQSGGKWELQLVRVCPSSFTRLDRSSSGAKAVDATRGEGEPSDRVVEIPDTPASFKSDGAFLFSPSEEMKKKKR